MIKVRRATEADIDAALLNPMPVFNTGTDHKPGCMHCLNNGWLYALEDQDGNLCGVLGGYLIWSGVASLGALFTPHLTKYRVSSIRAVNNLIDHTITGLKLHRLEMAVAADYKTGHRWAKALGFEPEGLMKKYGPDQRDHVLYGRT